MKIRFASLPFVFAVATAIQAPWFMGVRDGRLVDGLMAGGTITFFAASVTHAASRQGWRWTLAFIAMVTGGSLFAEATSLRTGFPFGSYRYGTHLGWTVFDVPILVPMAWTMMAYAALVVTRRLTAHPVAGPLVAAGALVAWDLFLDPLMVTDGYWTWQGHGPMWLGIPASNFVGWFGVMSCQMAALWWWPGQSFKWREGVIDDRVPCGLYAGTIAVHFVRALVLDRPLDHPLVGPIGAICIGGFVVAFLITVRAVAQRRLAPALVGPRPTCAEVCLEIAR